MARSEMTVTVTAADLPVVRANVRALDIVIGLIGSNYPKDIMGRFINECVDLKQDGLLDANVLFGVQWITDAIGEDTYRKLVEYLAERIRKDDEILLDEEEIRSMAAGVKKATVEVTDKLPEAAKAPAKRTTRKKATGAADGK